MCVRKKSVGEEREERDEKDLLARKKCACQHLPSSFVPTTPEKLDRRKKETSFPPPPPPSFPTLANKGRVGAHSACEEKRKERFRKCARNAGIYMP